MTGRLGFYLQTADHLVRDISRDTQLGQADLNLVIGRLEHGVRQLAIIRDCRDEPTARPPSNLIRFERRGSR
jgi:hypothetical protein